MDLTLCNMLFYMLHKLIFLLLVIRGTYAVNKENDVDIEINPITPYLGDKGVVIRCDTSGAIIREPAFLSVNLETTFHTNTPLVTLTKDAASMKIEWGRYYDDSFQVSKRMNVTGRIGKPGDDFLELTINKVLCSDEGKYQCVYAGKDSEANVDEVTKKGELIVYSYHGIPQISVNGKPHPMDYIPIQLKPGDEVDLECDGIVGKPPVPMVWAIKDMVKDNQYRKLEEEDGTLGSVFREVPEDDLCRFRSKLPLKFTMPDIPKDVVSINCQTGFSSAVVEFRNPITYGQPSVPAHKSSRLKVPAHKSSRLKVEPVVILEDANDVAQIGPRVLHFLMASTLIRMIHVTL